MSALDATYLLILPSAALCFGDGTNENNVGTWARDKGLLLISPLHQMIGVNGVIVILLLLRPLLL
jgi:hypothetical protein